MHHIGNWVMRAIRRAARWVRDLPPLLEVRIEMTAGDRPRAREGTPVRYERDVTRLTRPDAPHGITVVGPVREVTPDDPRLRP